MCKIKVGPNYQAELPELEADFTIDNSCIEKIKHPLGIICTYSTNVLNKEYLKLGMAVRLQYGWGIIVGRSLNQHRLQVELMDDDSVKEDIHYGEILECSFRRLLFDGHQLVYRLPRRLPKGEGAGRDREQQAARLQRGARALHPLNTRT